MLIVNPGGPGSSGVTMVKNRTIDNEDLSNAYDIVGFDPRGVGQSNPVHCLTNHEVDLLNFTEEAPQTPAQEKTVVRNYGSVGKDCQAHDPNVYKWLDTASVARDLDVLRAALHQPKVNWLGFSYGTKIGEIYAQLFPKHVGRMVLDGVVPINLTYFDETIVHARTQELGIKDYFATCAQRPTCPFATDPAHGEAKLIALMASLRAHPIEAFNPLRGAGFVDDGYLRDVINDYTDKREGYPALDKLLTPLITRHDATPIFNDVMFGLSRTKNGVYPASTRDGDSAFFAVKCMDTPVDVSVARIAQAARTAARINPLTGAGAVWSAAQCLNWPVRTGLPLRPFQNGGQPPILLIGSSHDFVTPLSWAVTMAKQIKSSRLLRTDNYGHTSFLEGNRCVDDTVVEYLLTGRTPGKDSSCENNEEGPVPTP